MVATPTPAFITVTMYDRFPPRSAVLSPVFVTRRSVPASAVTQMPVSFPGTASGVGLVTHAMLVSGPSALVGTDTVYAKLVLQPEGTTPRDAFVTTGPTGVTPAGSRSR